MAAIIDHIGINVADYPCAKALYSAALAPLGIGLIMAFGTAMGHHVEAAFPEWG
jgi:hypothetical protein